MFGRSAGEAAARRAALALTAGLLLYAGHPPLDQAWAGVVALVPLVAIARDLGGAARPWRSGFGWGLVAGAIFFGLLLDWVIPFGYLAWILLGGLQALTVAAFTGLLARWGDWRGRAALAVLWWVGLEALRSAWPFGGFAWGVLGYTQHGGGLLLPAARTVGVLGLSAVCAAVAVAIEAAGVRAWRARSGGPEAVFGAARTPLLAGVGVLVVAVVLGGSPPPATGRTVDIASVQGDAVLQGSSAAIVRRLDMGRIVRVAEEMLAATRPLADDPPEITVWPENALDANVTDPANEGVRAAAAEAVALLDGGPLLAGTFLDGPRPDTSHNALVVLTPGGVQDAYLKRQPVPLGEYVPLRRYVEWFPPLDQIPRDVVGGDRAQVLDVAGVAIGPVICFENVFPDLVHSQVRAGAELIVVATNNTPFFGSAMSEQHLALSQLRAVETGRWVLHAGITGISGIVDPEGVVTEETRQFDQAIIRGDLPLVTGLTVATRLGDGPALAAMVLSALAAGWLAVSRLRARR